MFFHRLRLRKRDLYRQNGTRSLPQDIFSDTTHEGPRLPRPPVTSQDDEAGVDFLGDTKDFFGRTSLGQPAFNPHAGIRYHKLFEFLPRFYQNVFRTGGDSSFAFAYRGGGHDMQDDEANAVIFGKGARQPEGAFSTA